MNQPGNTTKAKKPLRLAGSDIKLDGYNLADQADDDEDDESDVASMQMDVVCIYKGGLVKFMLDGRKYKMREGDVAKIPAAYACPVQLRPNSDPLPSVIQRETGGMVLPIGDPRVLKDDKTGEPLAFRAKRARDEAKARQVLQSNTQGA